MRHLIAKLLIIIAVFSAGAGLMVSAQGGFGSSDDDDPEEIREQSYEYIGTSECSDCHRDSASAHAGTPHALTLVELEEDLEPEENPVVADFSVGEDARTVTFPDDDTRPFTVDDVAYTLGSGVHAQAFVYQAEDGYFVFPAEWSVTEETWLPLDLGDEWLSDDYAFGPNCAGCHAQAVDLDTYEWDENGVMCESCHGPGLSHVEAVDDAGRDISEFERTEINTLINLGLDSATCGSCHVRGSSADGAHPFALGTGDYYPGEDFEAAFDLVDPENDDFFYTTGHARLSYMQYNESIMAGHANAYSDMAETVEDYGPECLACHSVAHLRLEQFMANEDIDPEFYSVESVVEEFPHGVTCASCHNPHPVAEEGEEALRTTCVSCHMDTDATDGLHVATMEVFQGVALVDEVEATPSAHFSAEDGPTCTSCHMAEIDTPRGPRSSHTFNIVDPAAALDEDTLQDSCSGCHEETPTNLSQLMTDIQDDTRARTEAARAALGDDTPDWVVTALDAVERDGSAGVHNYVYTDSLLDAVEAALGLLESDEGA